MSVAEELPLNARYFVWFRVLFNCRFYYPVFMVMFRDLGIGVKEFAMLNAVWAVTIVLLEVPSGAWADRMGRKPLVEWASLLMILEMVVLLAAFFVSSAFVMAVLLLNRVLSGAAEAMASGADEALAYDSFPEEERRKKWPLVMGRLTRAMPVGFIVALVLGGLLYDPGWINQVIAWVGGDFVLSASMAHRLPIILNLVTAVACWLVARRFIEAKVTHPTQASEFGLPDSWKQMGLTARWILGTPAPLLLITLGWLLESMIRLIYTVASDYYRLVGVPEGLFGFIGAAVSLVGLILSRYMERRVQSHGAGANFTLTAGLIFLGLCGMSFGVPFWGVALIMPAMMAVRFVHFFLSHYLNAVTDSHHRATVLSFKGLTMNLAYGGLMMLFAAQGAFLEWRGVGPDQVLSGAMPWWPLYFGISWLLFLWLERRIGGCSLTELCRKADDPASDSPDGLDPRS
jgi:MFS family permease